MSLLGFGMGLCFQLPYVWYYLGVKSSFQHAREQCESKSIFCVALLMYLFDLFVVCLTVFVNSFVRQFAMCLGVVAVLLLNVMDVFSVGGGALLDRPCMVFHRMCVLCL